MGGIHSKSEKVCETAFSVKKIAEKVRKSGRHIWAIWGNFGPFWVFLGHFGSFWVILGPCWTIFGHFGSFLAIFGPFRGMFGQSGKFQFFAAPLGSWGSLLECMVIMKAWLLLMVMITA